MNSFIDCRHLTACQLSGRTEVCVACVERLRQWPLQDRTPARDTRLRPSLQCLGIWSDCKKPRRTFTLALILTSASVVQESWVPSQRNVRSRSNAPTDVATFRCTESHSTRYTSLNDFIRGDWEAGFLGSWDANDLLTLLDTWQKGDVSLVRDGGDYEKCLKAIKAKGLVMPSKTDLYFPVSPLPCLSM